FESTVPERSDEGEVLAWRFTAGLLAHIATAIRPSFVLVIPIALGVALCSRRRWVHLLPVLGGYLIGAAIQFGLERIGIVRAPLAPDNNLLIAISSNSRATEFTAFPPEMQAKAKSLYLQFARTNPGTFLRQRLESLWELWGPKSLPGYRLEQETLIVKAVIVGRTLLLVGALVALVSRRSDSAVRLLWAPILAVTLVHVATFSNHRFTAPLEPFLFLLCAALLPRPRVGSAEPVPVQ
ncbi:MAG: hypothetical protein ACKO5K_14420, partial [Armatimonadota bacterium]